MTVQVTTEMLKVSIADELKAVKPPMEKLQNVCSLLRKEMEDYHWVGYYFVDRNSTSELVLGPFDGASTDHTRIGFGEGICGQAASTLSVFVVDDVNLESNYLSCSPSVRSEFVAPVVWKGRLVGEIDIDSRTVAAFKETDTIFLNWIAEVTSETVALAAGFQLAE